MSFSKAWDRKKGFKIQDLKKKPAYEPKPLKAAEPKEETPFFEKSRRGEK